MNLVKIDGQDPVWKKYADLAQPNFIAMTETQLREMVEKLWHNKLELLAHLEKVQIQLKTNKQTNDSKLNSYMRDKENLE